MTPPRPILAGYRLVVHGPCACFPFRYIQKSTCCSCVCRSLELCLHSLPYFFVLLRGPFFVFPLYSRVGLYLMMGLTFFWPTPWFPLFLAMLYCYSCYNNLILLGLFWASRLFLFLVAWHGYCFAFTCGLLCPFWLSLGHLWPICFLWIFSALLLILHSHELFY